MDTTKTRAELVSLAANELQLTGSGQDLEADDQVTIDARIDGLLGELAARGVVYISNEAYIPSELSGPLATLLAIECAPAFGKAKDYGAREDAEARLKVITQRQAAPNQYLETDRFLRQGGHYNYNQWQRGS